MGRNQYEGQLGQSRAYLDEERLTCYEEFIKQLMIYLSTPGASTRLLVGLAAKRVDEIPGDGYTTQQTRFSDELDEYVDSLVDGDGDAWLELLWTIRYLRGHGSRLYNLSKSTSPFDGEDLIFLTRGDNLESLGDLGERVRELTNYEEDFSVAVVRVNLEAGSITFHPLDC